MTDNTDWDAERLGSFVDDVERRGVAPLEELPPEDRAHLARAFREHAGTVQKRSSTSWREGAVVVLGAHLDAPAVLLLSLLSYSAACGIHPRGALRAFTAPLGGARAEALVAGLLRRRSSQYAYAPLIDELVIAYDLPLPTEPRFWEAWADHQRCDPEPGRRWSEHFLAVCAVPDALGIVTDDDADWRRRGEHLEALDAVEPLDRTQMLRALLSVVDRGDYRTSQRSATRWIRICGAEDLLWDERRRVLEALPSAEGPFVKLAVTRLLAGGPDGSALSEEELTRIALTVLARKEKMLRRTVLKALKELSAPSLELRETVSQLAADPDTTTAGAAAALGTRWGEPTAPELLGLWQEPAEARPQPLSDMDAEDLVLDDPALDELMGILQEDICGLQDNQEVALAHLLATAHARGLGPVRRAAGASLQHAAQNTVLGEMLHQVGRWGEEERPLHLVEAAPLTELVGRRVMEALRLLGRVPCLLSTPTHTAHRVSWEGFAARARVFREAGVAVAPTDVLTALARLDAAEVPEDLTDLAQPIEGLGATLAEVVEVWRRTPVRAGQLHIEPEDPARGEGGAPGGRLVATGDVPAVAEMLGIDGAWTEPFNPHRSWDEATVLNLLPAHPTRPAAEILHLLRLDDPPLWFRPLDRFMLAAACASPVTPLLAYAGLVMADRGDSSQRALVAEALLTAWEEGRLRPGCLVEAWGHEEWRLTWKVSGARISSTLSLLAQAGGLGLVWPLLTAITEELASAKRLPSTTSGVLETVLALLPEVRAAGVAVDLPSVVALAGRRGSAKAIRTARLIAEALGSGR